MPKQVIISKKVSIRDLFDDTQTHRLYKDILLWNANQILQGQAFFGNQFGFTLLGNWLIEHHRPFIDEYAGSHLTKSYRLHAKRNYIQSRLDDLIELRLIKKEGTTKSEKNKTDTPIYKFTPGGDLVGFLLAASKTPRNAQEESTHRDASYMVLGVLSIFLKRFESSTFLFLSNFITKCQEKELHTDSRFIRFMRNIFPYLYVSADFNVRMSRIMILCIPTVYPELADTFFQTLNELNEETKKLLLFQFKIDIETDYYYPRLTESSIVKEWESMRIQNVHDYSKVVLSGYCEECKSSYPFVLDIIKFIQLPDIFVVEIGVDPETMKEEEATTVLQKINCLKCHKENSLAIIPNWYAVEGTEPLIDTFYATRDPKSG
jgi:hypothetical protein